MKVDLDKVDLSIITMALLEFDLSFPTDRRKLSEQAKLQQDLVRKIHKKLLKIRNEAA